MAGSIYMDGEEQHLVKQIDFRFSDDSQGNVFIVTNVGDYVPEIKALLGEMLLLGVLIISFMGGLLIMWIYRSLLRPLQAAGGDQADPGWKSGLYARCG